MWSSTFSVWCLCRRKEGRVMKARLKFSKIGSMRFIGHLDVMRYFQKAFRRANIRVSYSQGYSPHQLMSFASPLGIGLSSDGEYLDIVLDDEEMTDDFLEKINAQMNEEITVKAFTRLQDDAKTSMSLLAACDYMICAKPMQSTFLQDNAKRKQMIGEIKEASSLLVTKKTKRSEKIVDIRENIYCIADDITSFEKETGQIYGDLSLEQEYEPLLFFQLTAGSIINIKPELVLELMHEKLGQEFRWTDFQIHRLEMYGDANMVKGEIHTKHTTPPCRLVPLSAYEAVES